MGASFCFPLEPEETSSKNYHDTVICDQNVPSFKGTYTLENGELLKMLQNVKWNFNCIIYSQTKYPNFPFSNAGPSLMINFGRLFSTVKNGY
jgi:hypothetical protein